MLTYDALRNDQFKINLRKTYAQDLEIVFNSFPYLSIKCALDNELSLDEFIEQKEYFKLVSILDPNDHEDIFDMQAEKRPLSRINLHQLEAPESPTLFYCQSGIRSRHLVQKILAQYPNAPVYSLVGGLEAYEERFMDEH